MMEKNPTDKRTDGDTAEAKAFVGFAYSGKHKVDCTQKRSFNLKQVFIIGQRLCKKFETVVPE